jgi:hypothetical protein
MILSLLVVQIELDDFLRLRIIHRSLSRATWRDWLFDSSGRVALVREAVGIVGRLVEQSPTFPPLMR